MYINNFHTLICVCIYVYLCMYMNVYIYMHTCVYIFSYIYMYTSMYIKIHGMGAEQKR